MMFLLKEDAFLTLNITEELVELVKLLNLEKLLVDGLKNLLKLFSVSSKTYKPMETLKILKI